jgi:hypothetical protein
MPQRITQHCVHFNFFTANPWERSHTLHIHTIATTTQCMSLCLIASGYGWSAWVSFAPIVFAICLIFSHVPQSIPFRRMCILSQRLRIFEQILQFYLMSFMPPPWLVGHQLVVGFR